MKIGIDISQLAYENTGVANYLKSLVSRLISLDKENEYVLFYASLRRPVPNLPILNQKNVTLKKFPFPPTLLDLIWNKLHMLEIERLIGPVDIFISSDWTEPPVQNAKKLTILYDLIVYKHPHETAATIIATQKRKLAWVKKETDKILCISNSTMHDAQRILDIEASRLRVIYPGIEL